jgi:hypothetical protein
MNHKKIVGDIKQAMLALIRNNIPVKLTAHLLNVGENTVKESIPSNLKEELRDFTEKGNTLKLHLLKIYAWLLADEMGCTVAIGTPVASGLLKILPSHLGLKAWLRFIEGVLLTQKIVTENRFSPNVSLKYRRMIDALYPPPIQEISARQVMEAILISMHAEEIPFPTEETVTSPQKALRTELEKLLRKEERPARFFDSVFVTVINEALLTQSIRAIEITTGFFEDEDMTEFTRMAEKYNLTLERSRQIKDKVLKRTQRYIENEYQVVSMPETTQIVCLEKAGEALRNKLETGSQLLTEKQDQIKKLVDFVVQHHNQETLQSHPEIQKLCSMEILPDDELAIHRLFQKKLDISINDLEFSVRAHTCLKSAKLLSLRDIVQYTQEELRKFRNFGGKTLSEVEQVLHEQGLKFGMNL